MDDKQKIEALRKCFEDVIWMAIRYAHGRHTYAPYMVRDAISKFREIFPDWEIMEDKTLASPEEGDIGGFVFNGDYLNDLFID